MENFAHLASLVVTLWVCSGLVFGAVAHKTNFCTMGAVSDVVNVGDWGRMRMWLLAIAVAVAGANALDWVGLVDLSRSAYPAARCPWIAYIVGGFLFGIGMTLASGCGSRSVVRVGGGNLKSLVVLVFLAISADMTLHGPFAPARVDVSSAVAMNFDQGQDLPWVVATQFGVGRHGLQLWITALIVIPLVFFVFKDRSFRATREQVIGGSVIGLVIVGGWYVTGHIGFIAEDPDTLQEAYLGSKTARPESLTYRRSGCQHARVVAVLDRQILETEFRRRCHRRHAARVIRLRTSHEKLPLGEFRLRGRYPQSHHRRHPDGFRRRHGDGLHHRPGHDRPIHARARLYSTFSSRSSPAPPRP